MEVKYKKLYPKVPTPVYTTSGSACFDLFSISEDGGIYYPDGNYIEYQTGIAFEIPHGFVGLLFPRSSNTKKDLILGNSVGVIDSDFRGYISFRYKLIDNNPFSEKNQENHIYKNGDRIGQMMIIPVNRIFLKEVESLSITDRGNGSYGSTGK